MHSRRAELFHAYSGIRPGDISEEEVQHEDGESLRPNARDDPFDWRMLEGHSRDELTESRQLAFVRSPAVSSDNASVHLAALVYLSDTYMLAAALNANPETIGEKIRDVAMGASLTHNVSLHDPTARIDEWLLSERDTSWGSDGRVLVHQRLWNVETGRLVMSGTQEGLIRLKPNKL
ncbi:putative acyl- thioesterase protein [Eutypa lata UCREL1]|uniref:Putative acyl-thioesterase protein n=1 Tax=Eutypa lata (strain UCR-EL1) TaxID=1287681 RepID=M7T5Y3_EUTLA|nr:putative acyl- thioesterase protein [Eutypa lata UCREL1]